MVARPVVRGCRFVVFFLCTPEMGLAFLSCCARDVGGNRVDRRCAVCMNWRGSRRMQVHDGFLSFSPSRSKRFVSRCASLHTPLHRLNITFSSHSFFYEPTNRSPLRPPSLFFPRCGEYSPAHVMCFFWFYCIARVWLRRSPTSSRGAAGDFLPSNSASRRCLSLFDFYF